MLDQSKPLPTYIHTNPNRAIIVPNIAKTKVDDDHASLD